MRKYWIPLVLLAVLILWWSFSRGDSAPIIHFSTAKPIRIESSVSTNGKVEPVDWAAARAETAGVVKTIDVQRGQEVKAGQTLVLLDTTSAQSDLASALARQQEAQADTLTLTQGGKASQLANLNDSIRTAQAAIDVAQRNYEAMQRLASQQAATKLQVQDAKDATERAKMQLAALEDQRRTLVTSIDKEVAQARLHGAQAEVGLAQHRVRLGDIRAPISGTLYQFDLKLGAYMQPGDLVGLIGNLDQVKVTVYVDEPDLGRVGVGMPVTITWDARPGLKWFGHVEKLPTQVTALGTRTVGEVTTIVDNPNHDLIPGVTVNATITSKVVPDALAIPKAALRVIQGANGVFKLEGDHLVWTTVKAGISDVNNVEITQGLKQGDKVADRVVEPSDAEIQNNMRVRASVD
jgi:HlyD family secretion protein